ncbi:Zn-ribbon domain-containing OB-fold protein [Trujillonella humicola]|uniref:Zn-ribbon domain-containing OB-fold protein n=1 Tax=Trujillonella humicola TaxID=3383699 RepID=UPI0039061A60
MTDPGPAADWLLDPGLAPQTDGHLAPLYAGAAAGRLTLPRCASCDLPLELEQQVCDGCGGDVVAWHDEVPEGTVHSVTTVHRREPGLVLVDRPYVVADVELAGGHRLLMAGVHPCPAPAIGSPVTVAFRHLGGVALPAFVPPPLSPEQEL